MAGPITLQERPRHHHRAAANAASVNTVRFQSSGLSESNHTTLKCHQGRGATIDWLEGATQPGRATPGSELKIDVSMPPSFLVDCGEFAAFLPLATDSYAAPCKTRHPGKRQVTFLFDSQQLVILGLALRVTH